MAENLEIIASVKIDFSKFKNDIEGAKRYLGTLQAEYAKVVDVFGEGSKEAKEAAEAVRQMTEYLKGAGAAGEGIDQPVKSLKAQLKEANAELQLAVDKFGIGSKEAGEAAAKVAKLKDTIGDAKTLTDAFNPDAKFKGLANAVQGAVGAITALQGAQALFGSESKELQQTLVKVQGALALSQGVNSVLEAKDSFIALGTSAKAALSGIRTGIAATGIGLLVVALGTIVAYWDDIKGAVSGVSSEQKKLNEETQKNLKTNQDKLSTLEGQDQQLKAQGKSEREILQLKIKQTDEAIKSAEVNLQNAKITKDAQIEAAKRNKEILQGLINFISLPITALLTGVDLLTEKLNSIGAISDEEFKKFGNLRDKFTGGLAEFIFDPEETAKEGDATIAEAEKTLNSLKEKKAGFDNNIKAIDKQAADKRAADANQAAERAAAFDAETQKKINENRINSIKDAAERQKAIAQQGYDDEVNELDKLLKSKQITQDQYNNREKVLKQKLEDEKQKITDEAAAKEQEKRKAAAAQIAELEFQAKLRGITDNEEKLRVERQAAFDKEKKDLDNQLKNKEITQDEYDKILRLKQQNLEADLTKIKEDGALARFNKDLELLEKQVENNQFQYDIQLEAINKEEQLLNDAKARGILTEEEYNKKLKDLSNKRLNVQLAEKEARAKITAQIADTALAGVKLLSSIFEKSKGLQIAGIITEQAGAIAKIITNTQAANAAAVAKYALIPGGQALSAQEITFNKINAGIGIASAVAAAVKGIQQIKSANASGGGASSAGGGGETGGGAAAAAPIAAQQTTTALPQEQINQLASANATVRAYVVESDVTGNQERITRLNRAARIS